MMENLKTMWKKTACAIMIVAVLVTGILTPAQTTQAAVYSWMRTAKTMYLNRTINGTARNNVKPTLMDPYDCYDDYFYVKIPARMELYLSISVIFLPLKRSLASAYAAEAPIRMLSTVVESATIKLFSRYLPNGCFVNTFL